jgi:hypothetical protein
MLGYSYVIGKRWRRNENEKEWISATRPEQVCSEENH